MALVQNGEISTDSVTLAFVWKRVDLVAVKNRVSAENVILLVVWIAA